MWQMNKELIINTLGDAVEIALLEDKKLVELHYERTQDQFAVGDLYLGKVKKLMQPINKLQNQQKLIKPTQHVRYLIDILIYKPFVFKIKILNFFMIFINYSYICETYSYIYH
jgi:hypothetical protein